MGTWQREELDRIAATDDLHIAPFRDDGKTYGTLTWIWSVVVDGALYVRAYNGPRSRWYRSAISQKAGRITVAGMRKEVSFEPVVVATNQSIEGAYGPKQGGSQYLAPMIGPRARAATIRITPIS